jgi:lactate dehydrogenase-like 2-hydroxyacid dehydrogenase
MVEFGAEFGRLDGEIIPLLPQSLKVITAGGAGFDWVDHEQLGRRGISQQKFGLLNKKKRDSVLQRCPRRR